jgi:prophage antirepressor-like protein
LGIGGAYAAPFFEEVCMNELTIFNFEEEQKVRSLIRDGEPWFVAKDVCDILGHSNSRMALEMLDDDEKGVSKVYTLYPSLVDPLIIVLYNSI